METIEKWIHTADGQTKADDPFQEEGKRFQLVRSRLLSNSYHGRWGTLTEACIKKNDIYYKSGGNKDFTYLLMDEDNGPYAGRTQQFNKRTHIVIR